MNYHIDKGSAKAAYLQLYEQLRRDLEEGVYPHGTRLPSKRLIASELGISVITVEHSFAMLCDDALCCARERSGYFSLHGGEERPSLPRGSLEAMQAAPELPEDFPFALYARTMRRVLSEEAEGIFRTAPGRGCAQLREALRQYLARSRGISVSAGQIVIGAGAEYLYTLIVQLLGRERVYAIEDPGYRRIREVYESNGVRCEALPMEANGISSEALAHSSASVLHITPYHSFPSGVTATAAKRREYALWAQKNGAAIVEDDYDAEFAESFHRLEPVFSLAPERTIYLNTFTKTLAPAVRVGYMLLPEELSREFDRKLGFYSCTVPVYEQLVLARFIENGDFERYIQRRKRSRRREEG